MTPPTKRHSVAISAESLAHRWARQEGAPAGAATVVDTEIAARRRGGTEWRVDDAIAASVIARPRNLLPSSADLGWAAASLGAAALLDELPGPEPRCWWPDRVQPLQPGADLHVAVTSVAALGPNRIDYAILTARLGPVTPLGDRDDLAARLVDHLRHAARWLDDPARLLTDYRRRCSTLGRTVSISLLPRGSTRGMAETVDEAFGLVVASPTGFREAVAVPALNRIDDQQP